MCKVLTHSSFAIVLLILFFCNMNVTLLGRLPHLETLTWQIVTQAGRVTLPGYVIKIKLEIIWTGRLSHLRRLPMEVTSHTWGLPPPCKQALKHTMR